MFHLLLENFTHNNSAMAVLVREKNEMAAVHLMKSHCLSSLLYACKTWSLKNKVHSANVQRRI